MSCTILVYLLSEKNVVSCIPGGDHKLVVLLCLVHLPAAKTTYGLIFSCFKPQILPD